MLRRVVLSAAIAACIFSGAEARTHHHRHRPADAVNSVQNGDTGNSTSNNQTAPVAPSGADAGSYIFPLVVLLGIAGFFVLKMKGQRADARRLAARQRREHAGQAALDVFEERELKPNFPYIFRTYEDDLLCMDRAGSRLRFISADTFNGDCVVTRDKEVLIADLVSVELVKNQSTYTESTTVSKKQGAIGRAVIGELIAGPAGAIVGASSAGSKSRTVGVEHTVYESSELIFGLADLDTPVIKFRTTDHAQSDQWLHRVRSAMANVRVLLRERTVDALPPPPQPLIGSADRV
jgi:hypothetical protein